ncbi:phage portal protein [Epibacterium mobile]|nr:phage portal protein [Tritonibacter mobilis]
MDEGQFCSLIANLVKECEAYRDERASDRVRAMEYYDGTMSDLPTDEGRSKVVSRDVRSAIKKVLPSVIRTILNNDKVVEYEPVGPGDEEAAEQATDYINYIVFPESDGRDAVEDAVLDAMRLRNGILKWWYDKKTEVSVSHHTGLDEMSLAKLVADDNVDVLEHSEREEFVDTEEGKIVTVVHDVKIKRLTTSGRPRVKAIPLENFLIHPDAVDLDESPVIGENCRLRRSDLVAMGYDRDVIADIPAAGSNSTEEEFEESTRRRDVYDLDQDADDPAMQEVEYYELLVRVDYDNDGIAELRRVVFAGDINEKYLLENEEWDDIYYGDVVCERRPHQWEGNSITDDVAEIQKIKTVLLRQTMDNLYWQNNLQPIVQEGAVTNPESVLSPQFGLPIRVKQGIDVRGALGTNAVPFVAKDSFAMLSYLDEEMTDRTGISDASSGMAPDALQNMTAKASAMIEQAGIGQTEMMVRTIAHDLKRMFKGLLKLVIQHQDKPRSIRLRNDWAEYDPRTWNAGMDATVNTGLGAGTRERDMMVMGQIMGLQEKLLAAFGAESNPYVKPDNLYNSIAKQAEAAGLRSVDMYFTKPDPQEIQALIQARQNQPSPEEQKVQGQMQLEQMKAQVEMALTDKKMQADAAKEKAQMDADLQVKLAELEKETEARRQEMLINQQKEAERLAFERWKEEQKLMLEREKMDREDARATMKYQADIQKAQAASIGRAFERNEKAEAQEQADV